MTTTRGVDSAAGVVAGVCAPAEGVCVAGGGLVGNEPGGVEDGDSVTGDVVRATVSVSLGGTGGALEQPNRTSKTTGIVSSAGRISTILTARFDAARGPNVTGPLARIRRVRGQSQSSELPVIADADSQHDAHAAYQASGSTCVAPESPDLSGGARCYSGRFMTGSPVLPSTTRRSPSASWSVTVYSVASPPVPGRGSRKLRMLMTTEVGVSSTDVTRVQSSQPDDVVTRMVWSSADR